MRKLYLLLVLTLFLAGFAHAVFRMEKLAAGGTGILLRLAPVDPRALLMGDYMALEYAVNEDIMSALRDAHGTRGSGEGEDARWPQSGTAVMRGNTLEGKGIPAEAVFVRLNDETPLAHDEFLLAFKVRGSRVLTAAPAFYFQEGHADAYANARFGRFRMDGSGKTLLMTLCDELGRDIQPYGDSE